MSHTTPHNLLPVSNAFCGRDTELDSLANQVVEHSVSHLCGLAGIGKTALATALGHRLRAGSDFPGGIWHVSLDAASGESAWAGDLTRILGTTGPGPGRLLVLWDQTDSLLEVDPEKIAATLSELFPSTLAHHLVVARQALPETPGTLLGGLAQEFAASVFDATRKAVGIHGAATLPAGATGNPLALLLAAHASANGTAPQVADTAETAIQRATTHLDTTGRRLLVILSALPGGVTGEALHSIIGDDWNDGLEALEKSGLAIASGSRHATHPAVTLWLEQHADEWRLDTYRDQVAFYLQHMLNACKEQVSSGNMGAVLRYMDGEWSNLRAAFSWAVKRIEQQGADMEEQQAVVMDFALGLFHLFTYRRMTADGIRWLDRGLAAGQTLGRPQELALLYDYRGLLRVEMNQQELAREDFLLAWQAFRNSDDDQPAAMTAYHLGQLALDMQNLAEAREYFELALPVLRRNKNRMFAAQVGTLLGQVYLKDHEYENAHEEFTDALELYAEGTLSPELRIAAMFGLAQASAQDRQPETAATEARQALEALMQMPPRAATALILNVVNTARSFASAGSGAILLEGLGAALEEALAQYRTKAPRPEFVNDWRLTCELFGRLASVVNTAAAAVGGDKEAREFLVELARDVDQSTGRLMRLEEWTQSLVAG
ncbi:MAG: tetratricopeptide repeat protein [Nitrospirota bacterium]|nr:tetratricopeptide repeat protein [Nitrospirota bacterium]